MNNRRFVPFDMFAMRVDVPVSTMVRVEDFAWTCGQCPIDRNSAIVTPNDLFAQTDYVCDMIEAVLPRVDMNTQSIGKLNVYYVDDGKSDLALNHIRRRLGPSHLIVPIAVPHFYYEGMMIEVDVFAGPKCERIVLANKKGIHIEMAHSGSMTLVYMSLNNPDTQLKQALSILKKHKIVPETLLSDHWFLTDPYFTSKDVLDTIHSSGFMTNKDATAKLAVSSDKVLVATLCFGCDFASNTMHTGDGTLNIYSKKQDNTLWITGICADPKADLVAQTTTIMSGINHALIVAGATFDNVAKLTAHYVGGATEDELHENMKVRHSYYIRPGPASTGLPVEGLLGHGCQISIDVIATL